jgi:hypothetical protein
MKISELACLGTEMIRRHPSQKYLISIAVNDAFMDLEDDDPQVQKLADWITTICQSDNQSYTVDADTIESNIF